MSPSLLGDLTLGERLRQRREELKLSVEKLAQSIRAPIEYISAFEENKYEIFSAKVYARGYFRKILHTLSLDEEEYLPEFEGEWEVGAGKKIEHLPLLENRGEEPYVTPRRVGLILGGAALAAILIFVVLRLGVFVSSPTLEVDEPGEDAVVLAPTIRVKGRTAKESRLTVNGRELRIDQSGSFDEEIELASGLNALEFLVEDRFGKKSREVRYVLVK